MELPAGHISRKTILKQLNRLLLLNKDLVQTIGTRTPKVLMEEGLLIKIKYAYMNGMNI